MSSTLHTGRLAPSPTGVLHLGNVRSLAIAWLAARAAGGQILLRVEDLLPGMEAHVAPMLDDLQWLGLHWDGPGPGALWSPEPDAGRPGWCLQSRRADVHAAVLEALLQAGLIYPCVCTRKDIEGAARAPHREDLGQPYPGTCQERFASLEAAEAVERDRAAAEQRPPLGVALRLRVPVAPVYFDDGLHGPQVADLPSSCGDLVVRRKDGGFAYMLAVVVDDLAMGVTDVVRGDDLLAATGQQLAVYAALSQVARGLLSSDAQPHLRPFWQRAADWMPPRHWHVPLVLGEDGRRLAKRNESLHLRQLRAAGVQPGQIVTWVGQSLGLGDAADFAQLVPRFSWSRLPRQPVRFGEAELRAWTGR